MLIIHDIQNVQYIYIQYIQYIIQYIQSIIEYIMFSSKMLHNGRLLTHRLSKGGQLCSVVGAHLVRRPELLEGAGLYTCHGCYGLVWKYNVGLLI